MNGAAPVTGSVVPTDKGTAARIRSDNAGAVLAASGIFKTARGGSLDLTLFPLGPSGVYDGTATIANIQCARRAGAGGPSGAISVVGLLEQLSDSGIVFTSAEAQFRTSPDGINRHQRLCRGRFAGRIQCRAATARRARP